MSSKSSHTYETVYILKPSLNDNDAGVIHQKVDSVITKFQGKVKHRDDWGLKELSFPIQKEMTGRYSVVVYNGTGGVVEEIERHFKILDQVIRYLTVNVEDDYDYTKSKKQLMASEEEVKRNREMRKKGEFGGKDFGGGRDFGGGGRDFGGGRDGGGGRGFDRDDRGGSGRPDRGDKPPERG